MRGTAAIAGALIATGLLIAERLPFHPFTIAQGLPGNAINKIVRDSRGFLWFCTGDGLSRFDGIEFVNFNSSPGLRARVWDLAETGSGEYWVATSGGLVRLSRTGASVRETFRPSRDPRSRAVLALKESPDGGLWVGTEAGLYRLHTGMGKFSPVETGPLPETWNEPAIAALEYDGAGNLWFGGYAGIGRIGRDGKVDRWTPRQQFPSYVVTSLHRDSDGTIWAGTEEGLCHMLAVPQPGKKPVQSCFGRSEGLPSQYIQSILRASDGRLWVGTLEGAAYGSSCDGPTAPFTPVTTRHGLSDADISAVAEDAHGDLWLGTAEDGAMKLSRESMVVFNEADGLASPNAVALFEDREDRLYAVTRSLTDLVLHRFDGTRFVAIRPKLPRTIAAFGRGYQQVALQDRSRQWWIATGEGLLHYPSGDLGGSARLYTRPASPDRPNVFRVYEDSRGDVWWSASSRISNSLARWESSSGSVQYFRDVDGLPPLSSNLPTAFVEDRAGDLWFGFESRGVARRRVEGGFEYFGPDEGGPDGRIRASYRDRDGRLWFGSASGLWRVDEPSAARPRFARYATAEGLSSLTVHSITGDRQGRIYAATSRGLDRLDSQSGSIEHFSTADGLPPGVFQAAYCDHSGAVWFATRHGIARLIPRTRVRNETAGAVLVTSVKVRGMERPISVVGETALTGLSLRSDENQVEFGFAAPRLKPGAGLLYQYRLEGGRSSDWSRPSNARSVNFASLAPGSYRFLVRAADARGSAASPAASVAFQVLPPVWATWWFQLAAGAAVCAGGYGWYRYRMRIMLEREQLRMRLATDLHDDIGSSLSSIAIWSELALQQARHGDGRLVRPLEQIGAASRDVIDCVSDMVWAINPKHDRFNELGSRMRRHTGELAAANRPISFVMEGEEREATLGPAVRREVFLVFKEALNNAVRHAGFTKCTTWLSIDRGWITLRVSDDGKGFDPRKCKAGNGLESLRRRAARLGGTLLIESSPGAGAIVELRVPAG